MSADPFDPSHDRRDDWHDISAMMSEYDEEVNGWGHRRHRQRYPLVPRRGDRLRDQVVGEWQPGPAPGSRIA